MAWVMILQKNLRNKKNPDPRYQFPKPRVMIPCREESEATAGGFWISCRGSTTLEWMQFDKKTHTQTHKQKIMKLEHHLKTQVSYWGCHSWTAKTRIVQHATGSLFERLLWSLPVHVMKRYSNHNMFCLRQHHLTFNKTKIKPLEYF